MLLIRDGDRHLAGQANQLTGAPVWHHRDGLFRRAPRQPTTVLQDETAALTTQRSRDALDHNLTGRAPSFVFWRLRNQLQFKRSARLCRHGPPHLGCIWTHRRGSLCVCCRRQTEPSGSRDTSSSARSGPRHRSMVPDASRARFLAYRPATKSSPLFWV
jgi:hypothetical protein